ncbi:MAG: hypothetical protein ACI4RD_06665 [Kiritimatiellia bacterium]
MMRRGGTKTVAALVAAVAGILHGGQGPGNVALAFRTWRAESVNCTVAGESEFAGRAPVYRLCYPADRPGEAGGVELAKTSLRQMLDSWLPPYVGADAAQVELAVYPLGSGGSFRLEYDVAGRKVAKRIELKALRQGVWTELAFDLELAPGQALEGVALRFDRGAAPVRLLFADAAVRLQDGRRYELLNPDPPRYMALMKTPARTRAAKREPQRPVLKFGLSTRFLLDSRDCLADFGAYLRRYLPEYDIVLQLARQTGVAFADILDELPENVFAQFAFGQHDLRYARLCDALVKNESGQMQHKPFNSTVATHPLLCETYRDLVRYCGSLGYGSIQQYDYVWMYPDGHWGFDAATVAAFREDLLGRSALLLDAADGEPERTVRFWDYYRDYFGPDLPQPADFGLAAWDDYRPSRATAASATLFRTLITFEWLRQAQRFGEWAHAYCHGGAADFLLNGEGHYNGNDHVYLPRLKHVGRVLPEFFDRTPVELELIYRVAGLGVRNARRYGKSWGITVETSRGAGGSQPYWSEKTGYVVCYALSALGYDTFEYDGAPVAPRWEKNLDRACGPWRSLSLGMADARGFRQAKLDGAAKAPSGVYLLTEHAMAGRYPNLCSPWAADFAEDDFRGLLCEEQLDCEMTVPQELDAVLPTAKVVFLSPWVTRKDVRERLARWADAAPDRTLVTERAEVVATAARLGLRRTQRATADRETLALPFAAKAGGVVVLFNRRAARDGHADWERWCREIWSKTMFRQQYRYEDLMYKDTVAGADARAEIPVAKDGVYRVYRPLADREELVTSVGGHLPLALGDAFCDLFYYGEDTAEYRAFLAAVKDERRLTADFFDPAP